jgi:hypothetical protein
MGDRPLQMPLAINSFSGRLAGRNPPCFSCCWRAARRPQVGVIDLIESAAWRASKTEAIDPVADFWWLDDDPSADDRDWLRMHGCEDRLIEVSSDRDADALLRARSRLSAL